ncbi:protein ILRUN-like [Babylonia areolata]|uniref:protein ILRUN-like n=1 Tax=Babylonia areolata TaxID=304850 RepID=UPI003FD44B30
MDVDNDLDGKLLQQFSAMGTTDREVLIAEFQKFLGNTVNPDSCAFFLDMNNWNLQAAICSYYDIEQPTVTLPSMTIVDDVTIGEGESIAPNTKFYKTWRIKNSGKERWPPGCSLRCLTGDHMGHPGWLMVEALNPGEACDINLELTSPAVTGVHQGQWRMATPTGHYFGESIWALVTVEENGLLGLTQQMSRIGDFAVPPEQQCRNQMALVPVSSASDIMSQTVNPFNGEQSQSGQQHAHPALTPQQSQWLMQSSTNTILHQDHSQDTEMS